MAKVREIRRKIKELEAMLAECGVNTDDVELGIDDDVDEAEAEPKKAEPKKAEPKKTEPKKATPKPAPKKAKKPAPKPEPEPEPEPEEDDDITAEAEPESEPEDTAEEEPANEEPVDEEPAEEPPIPESAAQSLLEQEEEDARQKVAIVKPFAIDGYRPDGPGKAYKYWDYEIRQWVMTTDFWAATQIAGDLWQPIWVWYFDGKVHHVMDKREIQKFLP